jgi:energy-coupling factor transporter ATPase
MRGTPFARRSLDHVDIAVRSGGAHGLVGATGSGKSTLMQHLNGLLRPQEGTVHIAGYDLGDAETDLRAIRRMAGLVFQRPETQIFEQYVGDEIAYGPKLAGLRREELRSRVRWAMDLVGLDFEGFKDRMTFALSGGEQRKVALASTLALRPRVLLLDEPTAGLDPRSRAELLERLNRLRTTGMTLILASHEMADITALTQRVTVMDHGQSRHTGSVAEIFADEDRLQNWGLEQPLVTQVAEALRSRGWPLAAGIVDTEHLTRALATATLESSR